MCNKLSLVMYMLPSFKVLFCMRVCLLVGALSPVNHILHEGDGKKDREERLEMSRISRNRVQLDS